MNEFDERNEFDEQLSEALGSPHDPTGSGGVEPSAAALDGIRERGLRRRRRKIAGGASAVVVTLFASGAVIVARDDGGSIQTAAPTPSVSSTATSAVPSTTSTVATVSSTSTVPQIAALPSTSAPPATVSPTSVPTTASSSTVPPTSAPTSTVPRTVPDTTAPATTVPTTTVPADEPAPFPLVPTIDADATAEVALQTVSLAVSGIWADPDPGRSLVVRRFGGDDADLEVLVDGEAVATVSMACLPTATVCTDSPRAWMIGPSLWISVDDIGVDVIYEFDLAAGTMTERLRSTDATIFEMVDVGGTPRMVVTHGDGIWSVLDVIDGSIVERVRTSAPTSEQNVMKLDRSGGRAFFAADFGGGSPLEVVYEVFDVASNEVVRSGSLRAELEYIDVIDVVGDRVVLSDPFLWHDVVADLTAGTVLAEGSRPACLLDDGTAVLGATWTNDDPAVGPVSLVGLDGSVVDTEAEGVSYEGGQIACGRERALVINEQGTITIVGADGSTGPAGFDLPVHQVGQFEGRHVALL